MRVTAQANGVQEEDVFPTVYRCNTRRKLRSMLTRHGFDAYVNGHEAEPTYLSFSRLAYALGVVHQRFAPGIFKVILPGFRQKKTICRNINRSHQREMFRVSAVWEQRCSEEDGIVSRINEAASKRWERAQATERQFWDEVVTGGEEFIRITTEKLCCVDLVKRHVPQALQQCSGKSTQVVEIGIGPLAVGVGSLLEPAETWRLTGVEPQPRRDRDFPEFIMAAYRVLQQRPVTYVQAKGEATGLRANSFDLAFCYNVIDHTPNWRGILVEVYRILKPSGYFVLTVDVLCLASYLRWAWILRWWPAATPMWSRIPPGSQRSNWSGCCRGLASSNCGPNGTPRSFDTGFWGKRVA